MTETKVVGRITDEYLPKWAQSSESKGQFYRKSVQEMAALREQLAALREGLEGLVQKWREGGDYIYCCLAAELQSLLTQTTPTVNSAEHSIPITAQQHQAMERALRKTAPPVNSEGSVISGEDSADLAGLYAHTLTSIWNIVTGIKQPDHQKIAQKILDAWGERDRLMGEDSGGGV